MTLGFTMGLLPAITIQVLCIFIVTFECSSIRYEPHWYSLDKRPLPQWYDESKFGIFIHWGVFSVPSYGSEWFWKRWHSGQQDYVDFMKQNYPPRFTYADFAPLFTAEFFDPDEWAAIFQASGAKYVVLTSKHHEGFCNWATNVSYNWNSVEVGPHRDLVGDLAGAIRGKTDLRFGVYHSLYEWYNPMYLHDMYELFQTRDFVEKKTMPELYELVTTYKPEIIWSDGDTGFPHYWNSTHFLAWLYNDSPVKETVVTNDRWGIGCRCRHGGFYTCNDHYNPGHLVSHKWENCMTVDKGSWGYRRNAQLQDYYKTDELISQLVTTVSCGGNLLLNVGPTHDGRIMPVFEERLREIGAWLTVNGEAIYATQPWSHQNDTITKDVWYTKKGSSVYAISLTWPIDNTLTLGAPRAQNTTSVSLLGYNRGPLKWTARPAGGISITIPPLNHKQMPCDHAWVFKLERLMN